MAKRGRAGAALAIAAWGSFIAGTLSVLGLAFLMVPLTEFALRFGPTEYFALMFFSLSARSVQSPKLPRTSVFATMISQLIATIGAALPSSARRFTMSVPEFLDGIEFTLVAIGFFAVGEVTINLEKLARGHVSQERING